MLNLIKKMGYNPYKVQGYIEEISKKEVFIISSFNHKKLTSYTKSVTISSVATYCLFDSIKYTITDKTVVYTYENGVASIRKFATKSEMLLAIIELWLEAYYNIDPKEKTNFFPDNFITNCVLEEEDLGNDSLEGLFYA